MLYGRALQPGQGCVSFLDFRGKTQVIVGRPCRKEICTSWPMSRKETDGKDRDPPDRGKPSSPEQGNILLHRPAARGGFRFAA